MNISLSHSIINIAVVPSALYSYLPKKWKNDVIVLNIGAFLHFLFIEAKIKTTLDSISAGFGDDILPKLHPSHIVWLQVRHLRLHAEGPVAPVISATAKI